MAALRIIQSPSVTLTWKSEARIASRRVTESAGAARRRRAGIRLGKRDSHVARLTHKR